MPITRTTPGLPSFMATPPVVLPSQKYQVPTTGAPMYRLMVAQALAAADKVTLAQANKAQAQALVDKAPMTSTQSRSNIYASAYAAAARVRGY